MNSYEVHQKFPVEMSPEEFRNAGHLLVDEIADFLEELPNKPVTSGESPQEIRAILKDTVLPAEGIPTVDLLKQTTKLLFEHSLFNGHPRFWGYITSSAAPLGALADMLASAVNPNVGAFALSPMATEIERQTISWMAEFIGYPDDCGGAFVSGGNMANFSGFLAARNNRLTNDLRKEGLSQISIAPNRQTEAAKENSRINNDGNRRFTVYCAKGTHTWIEKAVNLFGHGTESIRWIELTRSHQMNVTKLHEQINYDIQQGHKPFLVIGNAGSVGTGVVDPLDEIATVCKSNDLWFHVDGAYGVPAAALPENANIFKGLTSADSIALDPHKWFYSPLEAGCILVRKSHYLTDAFSYQPEYYNFGGEGAEKPVNFHEYGMQNSRGFRALKVWLMLQQAGKNGYIKRIRKDIELAESLFRLVEVTPGLEAVSHHLSITTFRYVPEDLSGSDDQYLNQLNEKLLNHLQSGGEVFLSNAIVDGKYCLRVCIVNFRTTYEDLEALVEIVKREGKRLHGILKQRT